MRFLGASDHICFCAAYTLAMFARSRHLILWLLLLALPMQSWAVVTMLHCGSSHQAMAQALLEVPHHPSADQAMHHDQHAAGHAMTSDGPADEPGLDEVSAFQCSACAACCSGVALLQFPGVFLKVPSATPSRATLSVPALSFFTSGPDRPPRLSLV
jgi:hypothetical protein